MLDTAPPSLAAPDAERGRGRRRAGRVLPALLLVLVAVVVVATHLSSYRAFSPIDEFQHFDYVAELLDGGVPQTGERVGAEAMATESCRGVDAPGVVLPPCGATEQQRPELYQEAGFNTAAGHGPLYYLVGAGVGAALSATTPLDLFDGARAAGVLWLGGGLLLLLAAGRAAGAPTAPLLGVALWLTGAPVLLHAHATINPDGTALVAGGLLLLAALRWDAGRWPLWALGLAGATATALKVTNIVAVLAVAVLLLLRTRSDEPGAAAWVRSALRTRVLPLAVLGASAVTPVLLWGRLTAGTAVADPATVPMTERFTVARIGVAEVLGNVPTAITPLNGFTPSFLAVSSFVALSTAALGWLLLAGTVGGALARSAEGLLAPLARGTALLGLLGGPLIVLLTYVTASVYFPVPPRYGLSLVPLMAVAVALLVRSRAAGRVLLGLGALAPLTVVSAAF